MVGQLQCTKLHGLADRSVGLSFSRSVSRPFSLTALVSGSQSAVVSGSKGPSWRQTSYLNACLTAAGAV